MKAHWLVAATLALAAGLAVGCTEKTKTTTPTPLSRQPAQSAAPSATGTTGSNAGRAAATATASSSAASAAAATARPSAAATQASAPQAGRSAVSPSSAADVVKLLRPSVVRVRTEASQVGAFGAVQRAAGTGTGVILDTDGHVLTNNHVVTLGSDRQAQKISVDLSDGQVATAQLVGRDQNSDLAVLKIDAKNLTPAKFADPSTIEVGQDVIAIGYALDLGSTPSVTKGVVSALGREIDETLSSQAGSGGIPNIVGDAIQTDAAINPGNSGGPLVNMSGEVIGINTAGIFSQGTSGEPVQGINFAISVETVQPVVKALMSQGKVNRGFIGVNLVPITADTAAAQKIPVSDGAGIEQVVANTPAQQAGLQAGDVIVKAGNKDIHSVGDLQQVLIENGPGTKLHIEYYRGSERRSADVTLSSRPSAT
jgi:S1-C subfamily serine protease